VFFCCSNRLEWEHEKAKELREVEQMEKKIIGMKEQINEEKIKVNKSMTDVAIYVEDK
jgi:hypothetical protein